jgi:type II secretory pathway component GspD/PulD (secretin)
MRKTRAIFLVLFAGVMAFSVAAWGQEKEADQKPTGVPVVRKLIQVRYVDPYAVQRLFSAQNKLSPSPWGVINVDETMRVLTVAGSASEVQDVEETIKKLDVPPVPGKDVEITAYFLVASRQPNTPSDFPPILNDVVAELKKVLTYQSFSLANTAIMRSLDGQRGTITGAVDKGIPPDQFRLDYRRLTVITQEKQAIIHLDNLDFSIWSQKHWEKGSPTNPDRQVDASNLAGISTSVDIPVGQKVVVGKTAFGSAFENSDNALILVLTAKVMD